MNRIELELKLFNEQYLTEQPLEVETIDHIESIFMKQGHSGFSANYCFKYLKMLAEKPTETLEILDNMLKTDNEPMQQLITQNIMEIYNLIKEYSTIKQKAIIDLIEGKPLTPILGLENEWEYDPILSNDEVYKAYTNKRYYRLTKYVFPDGIEIATCLDDVAYSDNGGYYTFSTGRFGRRQITFPYMPPEKPEVICIYEVEGKSPFILTDPKTIAQVKENYLKNREEN